MRDYELVVVLNPQMDPIQVNATVDRLQRLVAQGGGEITKRDDWGIRRLAYPIHHFREGNYIVAQLKLDPSKTDEIREHLRLSEEVLRHLMVKVEPMAKVEQ